MRVTTKSGPVRLRYASLTAALVILVAFALRSVTQAFLVPSSSMEPTLLPGDHVLVVRVLSGSPRHGDVVVFNGPAGTAMIKRVIGVPGDSVQFENGRVLINGEEISETGYARGSTTMTDSLRVVPRDHLFLLGDNRDHSADSRVFGFIRTDALVGRARLIYWSSATGAGSGGVRWNRLFRLIE